MTKFDGTLTLEELTRLADQREIDTVLLIFTDLYGRFMGKRLEADFFLQEAVKHGTHACDYLLTADMEMKPVSGYRFANWQKGYGDFHLVPDFSTLRIASWLDKTALLICDVEDEGLNQLVAQAPRSILKKQLAVARAMGYEVKASSEIEYYIFQNSYQEAASKGYGALSPAGWYIEDYHMLQGSREEGFNGAVRRHLTKSGVPIESSKGEWGLGQHELNMRYTDALAMADHHSIFKQCLKEVADQMGLTVTFMAKYSADQAGSSCHVHLSLWKEGTNAFFGDKQLGPLQCSEIFGWFLGGWMAHAHEFMVYYAPTVNSYKRYQAGSWAPTRLAWSRDNRTAAFRIVSHNKSLRIECRIPGADCNPYLVYAAAVASGLDGIARKIEPPPVFEGDVYAASELPTVPASLGEAIQPFEESSFTREVLGDDVVDHYSHFFHTEQEAYDRAVTDWERWRYFERI